MYFTGRADENLGGPEEGPSVKSKVPKILRYYSLEPTNLFYVVKFFVVMVILKILRWEGFCQNSAVCPKYNYKCPYKSKARDWHRKLEAM